MAQQTYDVMITSNEYNELKIYKKEHTLLSQKLISITEQLKEATFEANSLRKDLDKKKAQNNYLLDQIQGILNIELIQVPDNLQPGKSVSFEVLGQSVFQPEKALERKQAIEVQVLNKKYSLLLHKISDFLKLQQQKDDRIVQLNQIISQRDQSIAKLQRITQQAGDKKTKEIIEYQKSMYEKKLAAVHTEMSAVKKMLDQREVLLKKHIAENADLQKQLKSSKILVQKHKEENKKLDQLLRDLSERTKSLEKIVQSSKKKGSNSLPKLETIVRIKTLIDEHIREVEKNLRQIEGLSRQQIKNLVQLEMKELVEYISKSIQNRN